MTTKTTRRARTATLFGAAFVLSLAAAASPALAARPMAPPSPAPYLATYAPRHSGTHHSGGGGNGGGNSKHHSSNGGRLGAAQTCKENPINPSGSDLVTDWYKNCAEQSNTGCPACYLYRDVVKTNPPSGYMYSGDSKRSKIIPLRATTGLEAVVGGESLLPLWKTAITDAIAGNIINPNIGPIKFPVAYVNSLDARSQHQLHIHIGAALPAFYECARDLIKNPPQGGKWGKLTGTCDGVHLPNSKYGVAMAVKSVAPDNVAAAIQEGFKGKVVPGAKSNDMYTDDVLKRTGVLVQPNEQVKGELLVFLIYNTDDDMIYGK